MDAKLLLVLAAVCLPLRHLQLNSGYGDRVHPLIGKLKFHAGIDLAARSDTVFAIADGLVKATGFDKRLGRYIVISHRELESCYGHLSVIGVRAGDSVACGQPLGLTGSTGMATGEHLHFSLKYKATSIDPLEFLCGWEQFQLFLNQQDHEKKHERTDR